MGLAMNVCADVLTLQEVKPHIYRDTESVSQRESKRERERESVRVCQSLLVSVSDCVRTRNNEMLYDFMER